MSADNLPYGIFVWDTETTGTNVEEDRILTCYAMAQNRDGEVKWERSWTIDPGIEVPEGAAAVHGMSTEWIREHGRKDAKQAILEIHGSLMAAALGKVPIVAYNLSYDLSLLDRELRRHCGGGTRIVDGNLFYDPIVHDRARDKYRKGNRKLMTVAAHHGVPIDESRLHEAQYDVEVTAALTWKLLRKERASIHELQDLLPGWHREWAENLEDYFARTGKTEENGDRITIDGDWPLRTYREESE